MGARMKESSWFGRLWAVGPSLRVPTCAALVLCLILTATLANGQIVLRASAGNPLLRVGSASVGLGDVSITSDPGNASVSAGSKALTQLIVLTYDVNLVNTEQAAAFVTQGGVTSQGTGFDCGPGTTIGSGYGAGGWVVLSGDPAGIQVVFTNFTCTGGVTTLSWYRIGTHQVAIVFRLAPNATLTFGAGAGTGRVAIAGVRGDGGPYPPPLPTVPVYLAASFFLAAGSTALTVGTFGTPPWPEAPAVATGSPSAIYADSAIVWASVSPNTEATNAWFEWGTTPALGNQTPQQSAGSGTAMSTVSQRISGLTRGVTYYYRAAAQNSGGFVYGLTLQFTASTPPIVTTWPASSIGSDAATLNGRVTPNGEATNAWFEWGETSGTLTKSTPQPVGADSLVPVALWLTGLAPNTTYFYRAAASNASGTSYGSLMAFGTTQSGFTGAVYASAHATGAQQARDTGLSEATRDVSVSLSGGPLSSPGDGRIASVFLTYSGTITNAVTSSDSSLTNANGTLSASGISVSFQGFSFPAGTTRFSWFASGNILTVTLFLDASTLSVGPGASIVVHGVRVNATGTGSAVTASLSLAPQDVMSWAESEITVAPKAPGLASAGSSPSGFLTGGSFASAARACLLATTPAAATYALESGQTMTVGGQTAPQFGVRLTTGFAGAFTSRSDEAEKSGSEVTNGTRFRIQFSGVPAGISFWVPQLVSTSSLTLTVVDSTGSPLAAASATVANRVDAAGGSATVEYEVTRGSALNDLITVPISITGSAAGSGPFSGQIALAPISSVDSQSSSAPIVRFANQGAISTSGFFAIAACVAPVITSLSPATVIAGAPAFTLTVQGSNFVPGSSIVFKRPGATVADSRTTTYVSDTQLQTTIDTQDVGVAGLAVVMVNNGPGAGGTSNEYNLTVASGTTTGSVSLSLQSAASTLRSQGATEATGDVTLVATSADAGISSAGGGTVWLNLVYSAPIIALGRESQNWSLAASNGSASGFDCTAGSVISGSMLALGSGAPPGIKVTLQNITCTGRTTTISRRLTGDTLSVSFSLPANASVTFGAGGAPAGITVHGVRVNAGSLSGSGTVTVTVGSSPAGAFLASPSPTATVGVVLPGLDLTGTLPAGFVTAAPFASAAGACAMPVTPSGSTAVLAPDQSLQVNGQAAPRFGARLTEGFPGAFTTREQERARGGEGLAGFIANGTRFEIFLNSIPPGATLWAPQAVSNGGLSLTLVVSNDPLAGGSETIANRIEPVLDSSTGAYMAAIIYEATVNNATGSAASITIPTSITGAAMGAMSAAIAMSPIYSSLTAPIFVSYVSAPVLQGGLFALKGCDVNTAVYADRDAFVRATATNAVTGFDDLPAGTAAPFSSGAVAFSDGPIVVNSIAGSPISFWFPAVGSAPNCVERGMGKATFANDVFAAGFDFVTGLGDAFANNTSLNWTLLSSSAAVVAAGSAVYDFSSSHSVSFFGVVSDVPFRSLVLTRTIVQQSGWLNWFVDNLRYSSTASRSYLAGDIFPVPSSSGDLNSDGAYNNAGEFGDGSLTILDLIYALRAVTNVPGFRPPSCSDRFDAIDSFPKDTDTARGGDGILNTVDLIYTLRRVTNVDTLRPRRFSRGLVCTTGAASEYQPLRQADGQAASLTLEMGALQSTAAGGMGVPIYLAAWEDMALAGLSFSLGTVNPGSSGQLKFTPPSALSPTLVDNGLPGALAVAWLEGFSLRAAEPLLLGWITTLHPGSELRFYGAAAHDRTDQPLRVGMGGAAAR